MIRNYFKIAWRNLKNDTFFSFVNIVGLGLGIAVSLLIVQYLRGEWYVDKHHTDYAHIYQINTEFDFGESQQNYAMGPSPMANTLAAYYPEVESATRLLVPPAVTEYLLRKDDLSFFESKGIYADNNFFEIFTYPFVEGSVESALKNPNDIVISAALAKKLFGKEPALGKSLIINTLWGDMTCQISAVVQTNTYKSHIDVELFVNMETGAIGDRFANLDEWAGNNLYYTYLKLKPNAEARTLEQKLPALIEAKAGDRLRNLGFSKSHTLLPLEDIYLKSQANGNHGPQGSITFFYIFAVTGFFILVIACINFMNLSTARSSLRANEVAVKKVLGANRGNLAIQFFSESVLYVFLSFLVALFFMLIAQVFLQSQLNLELPAIRWQDWKLGLWVISILSFTSFFAGSYPALMLSSFSPMSIFNGRLGNHFSAAQVRKILVIVQFVISIMLIQGILVINTQMKYIQKEDLGYSQTEKIVLPLQTQIAAKNEQVLKQALTGLVSVENVGIASTHPGISSVEDMLVFGEGKSREENIHIKLNWADSDFMSTMGFTFLKGRNFRLADTSYAIVTKGALAGLGYTMDNALNKKIRWNWNGVEESRIIIGIIEDYHSESLRDLIKPQLFMYNTGNTQNFIVASLQSHDLQKTISDVEEVWESVNEADPFEFYFMNEKVQHAYEAEIRMSSLISLFTFLAILISCFGLIGLAAFAADRRKKEIGVRKVLGASISSIVQLLSKEFIVLVFIALCIATPFSWYLSSEWLAGFSYRIDMPWGIYMWAGILAMVICVFMVSFQAIKAAKANPINSLKTE